MSYFVDISEGHPSATPILSELRKHNIELGKRGGFDLKTDEANILACIIGLKPSGTCQLDGGCTLDKGVEMGICHFSAIPTLAIFEDVNIKKEIFSTLKTKLESKGFLVSPRGKEVACSAFLQESLSSLRQYYITNKFPDKEFKERRAFREGLNNFLAEVWNKFLFEPSVPEQLLNKT